MPKFQIDFNAYDQNKFHEPTPYADHAMQLCQESSGGGTTAVVTAAGLPADLSVNSLKIKGADVTPASYVTFTYLSNNHYSKAQTDSKHVKVTATGNMDTLTSEPYIGSVLIEPPATATAATTLTITLPTIATTKFHRIHIIRDPASGTAAKVKLVANTGNTITSPFAAGIDMNAGDSVTVVSSFKAVWYIA